MAFGLRLDRARVAFLHDIVMAAASFPLSVYLRLGDRMAAEAQDYLLPGTILFAAIATVVFRLSKMHRGIWRYASLDDLVAITKTVTLAILIFLPLLFLFTRLELFPRSVPFINWFVLMTLLGGPRFAYRVFKDRRTEHLLEAGEHRRVPVLLVGVNDAAETFIRQEARDRDASYRIVGVVDDKGTRIGRTMHGVPVLGGLDELEDIVERRADPRPQRIVLTHQRLEGAAVRDLLRRADALGLGLARLPRLSDLRSGVEDPLEAQPIAVEDLLGRPQAVLDRDAMRRLICGKSVLVTGAGGTIGSELTRQIAAFAPARLVLFDASELNLYQIDLEIAAAYPGLDQPTELGDVRDRTRLDMVFARHAPDLVFHAAALKHVPMVEHNPLEGVLTNTVGSRNVADACRNAGVRMMVQISTDKAVNPSSVMGATKRLAECYTQALANAAGGRNETRYVTVRFGNVLGSTGSVVPLFQKQIAGGGPVTVTHPDVTRYFMSVREAVELVLQASAIGEEDTAACGRIFELEMGEPVRILDLARQMIRLAGKRPDLDIAITFTGLRPGEKLQEELLHAGEDLVPTSNPNLRLADPRTVDLPLLQRALDELEDACRSGKQELALSMVRRLVPEFGGQEERSALSG
ncbi:MAG: NAD-dependent epimerase/dehydratase family protein [Alphaproteobacteria bacterium]|nr:NAD-dependent epimerase/dehydratase family protein [Alphaproteobacteria bacterium]